MTQTKLPRLNILLCDEDKVFTKDLSKSLKVNINKEIDLVLKYSVEESLDYLAQLSSDSMDLIISAIKFEKNDMDGLDFYLHLFAHESKIPFIALTTGAQELLPKVNNMNFYSFDKKCDIKFLVQFILRLFPDDC